MFKNKTNTLVAIFLFGVAFLLIDSIVNNTDPFSGHVIDKHYNSERKNTSTGYGMTNTGQNGVFIQSTTEDEKFILIVKKDNGKVVSVECEPELYYKKKVGNKINCKAYKGWFTGITYSLRGVQ